MNASIRLLLPLGSKPSVMDSVKNAAKAVGEKVQETTSSVSKEGNKAVAKDDTASVGTRASAAKDAVGDKINEEKAKS